MGARLSKSRSSRVTVDESARLYSKPTGQVVHRNIDLSRLRNLVLSGKVRRVAQLCCAGSSPGGGKQRAACALGAEARAGR